jgi:hypothetical protein
MLDPLDHVQFHYVLFKLGITWVFVRKTWSEGIGVAKNAKNAILPVKADLRSIVD